MEVVADSPMAESFSGSTPPSPFPLPPSDTSLSAHYACTHCDLSFEPPSPQLFSFNSPQGMCPECGGLGEIYTFDPERLVPDPSRSFQQGCIELVGPWREMGRWRRHIYRGVAETLERKHGLPHGHGAGNRLGGARPEAAARPALGHRRRAHHVHLAERPVGLQVGRQVRGHHPQAALAVSHHAKPACSGGSWKSTCASSAAPLASGQRLNPQARAVTVTTPHRRSSPIGPSGRCPRSARLAGLRRRGVLQRAGAGRHAARRSPPRCSRRSAAGCGSSRTWGSTTSRSTAPRRRSPAARSQRIRLAGQIGCGLVGVLYILDEPSIGLHPRDNDRLLDTLARLRDQGNTVVVVEHDEDTMRAADHIVDFGPGPGVRGGAGRGRRAGRADHRRAARASPGSIWPASGGSRSRARRRPTGDEQAASSAAPRTTTSRTSTSRSRWACSSASPACPARARARWSTTSWSRRCAAT